MKQWTNVQTYKVLDAQTNAANQQIDSQEEKLNLNRINPEIENKCATCSTTQYDVNHLFLSSENNRPDNQWPLDPWA